MSALPVKKILPAYSQVAEQLRRLILAGEFQPGDRLPIEADLAASFSVSRSTVREALRELSSQNLVKTSRGVRGGSYVSHPDPQELSGMLETGLGHLTGAKALSVTEILEARELLEVPASRFAAERRTDEHVEILLQSADVTSSTSYHPGVFDETVNFHQTILAAADNALLMVMTAPIFRVLAKRFLREVSPRDFTVEVCADHAEIARAIADSDPDRAAVAMQGHLSHVAKIYEAIDREMMAKGSSLITSDK